MDCFFRKYHESLYNCTKPYQYVGGEFLSFNKDFAKSKVRFAFAFPDKYEIGISNLGLRVLYNQVNSHPDYMADRVYAPEADFNPEPLYALESKQAIKDFDAVGFSIQYELAYPTILKMLDMAGIPYKNSERTDEHPIILAGGPCAYNPLPIADFVDGFLIGDGEDSILEVCKVLEETKGLAGLFKKCHKKNCAIKLRNCLKILSDTVFIISSRQSNSRNKKGLRQNVQILPARARKSSD